MHLESRGVVLHVDDDPEILGSMALLLGSEGYETGRAASGSAALDLVLQGLRPDVLIVDFNLDGDRNGAEVAEDLRRALGYALPVVVLTGDPSNAETPWITDAPVWMARKPIGGRLVATAMPSLVQLSRTLRALDSNFASR